MASKAEMEEEVRVLRLLVYGRPAREDCLNSCSCGSLYHGGEICWGELRVDHQVACVCPKHPDDPPMPTMYINNQGWALSQEPM